MVALGLGLFRMSEELLYMVAMLVDRHHGGHVVYLFIIIHYLLMIKCTRFFSSRSPDGVSLLTREFLAREFREFLEKNLAKRFY